MCRKLETVLAGSGMNPRELWRKFSSSAVHTQRCHDDLASPSCKHPSDEKFEASGSAHSEERVDGNGSNEKLSGSVLTDEETRSRVSFHEEYSGNNTNRETVTTSLCPAGPMCLQDVNKRVSDDNSSTEAQFTCSALDGFRAEAPCNDCGIVCSSGHSSVDSNFVQVGAEIPAVLVEDDVAKMRPAGSGSIGNQDDTCDDQHDDAPLETIELYAMANQEDRSDIHDSMLYAVCHRTRKLRSFKKKITDALASKRLREKEYEQLAIWFGDATMTSDLDTAEETLSSKTTSAIDTKRPLEPEDDSEWELL
ncbi:PREDICTED: uncharacterized protein LOC104823260 isoform X1 [Tarenaya hassleriana]|uniref:uncharacterized protein LOC104823260 isoform X1 n=1 Tax=Tarenaya hassleriana TaxID=28532 RepID=UPI00053C118E|nr:PREDICTED: uncharacterized protein LOC104823260 isoform X1 [Tarenaya hassleriana]XP_010553055.1 PREDICTED: uncharacterized protein LOC104823260 isoform X1 [Tarenaya hassleriana]XP_010553063.1 PREDICTED: uncharacterized protein LOC104823260 isoform X1 [Tarenaya hassleriana]XP_010553070.1 PREDICTED: uncharacterized protein LOC104823260 isoform X1 [Tarenaya hassleriana]XP_010553081.1 PREDICTED: uncharacterized protein LOC104823260 isoform X1 [Tarenaya hassleriana]XP_010553087.1 PREDICTED: unch